MPRLEQIITKIERQFRAHPIASSATLGLILLGAISMFVAGSTVRAAPEPLPPQAAAPNVYEQFAISLTLPVSADLGSSTPITATIEGVGPSVLGQFRVEWTTPGSTPLTSTLTLNGGVVTSSINYPFSTLGSVPITATLLWETGGQVLRPKSNTKTLLVRGGSIGVTPVTPIFNREELVTFTLSLPPAQPGSYRLISDFGDQNGDTDVITLTTATTTTYPISHTYRTAGTFAPSFTLYPSSGAVTSDTRLAASGALQVTVRDFALSLTVPVSAELGSSTPLSATIEGVGPSVLGQFRVEWTTPGSTPLTSTLTLNGGVVTSSINYPFSTLGSVPITATLLWETGGQVLRPKSNTKTLLVRGGSIGVTPVTPIFNREELVTFTLSLPPAQPGSYRLISNFGDRNERTEVITVTTTTTTTLPISHTYRTVGTFTPSFTLYPSGGDTLLAASSDKLRIPVTGPVFAPILAKPFPICNGTGSNQTLASMQPLDPENKLLRQAAAYSCSSYVLGNPSQSYYLLQLQPNERIEVTLNRIQEGTDLDLYLYRGRSSANANIVASSALQNQLEEKIVYSYQGTTPQEFTLRIYAYTLSPIPGNDSYLLTSQIKALQ